MKKPKPKGLPVVRCSEERKIEDREMFEEQQLQRNAVADGTRRHFKHPAKGRWS